MSRIKIGLLGLGKMGQNHLRCLSTLKEVEVSFIYDVDQNVCESLSSHYGIQISDNLERDLQSVHGIVIVTPTSTHQEYIKRVSQHVKNIFVEKPLTDCLGFSEEVVQLAKQLRLNIQVGYIERYNSAFVALKKVLGNTDRIINIDFSRTNKMSQRITDVDVVMDLMIHDIDLALTVNGKPQRITAHGYVKKGMIEYARAVMTHQNGTFSNIVASRVTEKRVRDISATCDDMYIDCNLLNKDVFVNKQFIEAQYLNHVSISARSETIDVRPQEGLMLELLDFVALCRGENVEVANEKDDLAAMQIANEIQKQIIDTSTTNCFLL